MHNHHTFHCSLPIQILKYTVKNTSHLEIIIKVSKILLHQFTKIKKVNKKKLLQHGGQFDNLHLIPCPSLLHSVWLQHEPVGHFSFPPSSSEKVEQTCLVKLCAKFSTFSIAITITLHWQIPGNFNILRKYALQYYEYQLIDKYLKYFVL